MSLRTRTLSGIRKFSSLVIAGLLLCAATGDANAQPYDNKSTAEGWVWALLKQGKTADLDDRCSGMGIAVAESMDKPDWKHTCRQLKPDFLTDLLTKLPWREELRPIGVNIAGAWIDGDIELNNAKFYRALEIDRSMVEGSVLLESVRTDSNIAFSRSRIVGVFNAAKLRSEMSLILTMSTVTESISLSGAKVEGFVKAEDAVIRRSLDAPQLQVGINLQIARTSFGHVNLLGARVQGLVNMRGSTVVGAVNMNGIHAGDVFLGSLPGTHASYKGVDLTAATVVGDVDLQGATFEGPLSLNGASAKRLLMRSNNDNRATFVDVNLVAARISGSLLMQGSSFDGKLVANGMHIGGNLMMGRSEENKRKEDDKINPTTFKAILLGGTKVIGHLNMEDSIFKDNVSANTLEIGGHLIMCNVVSNSKMDLRYTRVAGNVDARGATFSELDLAGAHIAADLTLGNHDKGGAMDWKKAPPGNLNLRNARVANLMDVADAWPGKGNLQIDGFTFSRLGDRRTPKWWDEEWIRRDPHYTPGPYEQIATAYALAGDRGAAEQMRFLGRVRQREDEKHWVAWLAAIFLEYVAGFGIGDYTFRVLWWVVGISTLGAVYLWSAVPTAQEKGRAWCFGASLSRLLPVIEINQEFTDFFNDPKRERLTGFQSAVFSVIGMLGWLLGAILVAAIAGLTQEI